MNRHKHSGHMAAYAADAMETDRPWVRWEVGSDLDKWRTLVNQPLWLPTHKYRRKTNEQIACDLLGQAHKALEEHSAEICEPNVDHIQRMVWDARKLIQEPKQHTIVLTTEQLGEVILACELVGWENEDFLSAEQILINTLNGEQA